MKVLKIELTQTMAHYKEPYSLDYKRTYPLPPLSTIIGMLHTSCNYKEYHPMDIAISGNFDSLMKRYYINHLLYNNSQEPDRGILVKFNTNDVIHSKYIKVAEPTVGQDANYLEKKYILIYNEQLLNKYIELKTDSKNLESIIKSISDEIKEIESEIKAKEKQINSKGKLSDEEKQIICDLILILKDDLSHKTNELDKNSDLYSDLFKELSTYKTILTKPQKYEVLTNVHLHIYVKSDEQTLNDIYENQGNMIALGRSEDVIDLISCEFVELEEVENDEEDDMLINDLYYIDINTIRENKIAMNQGIKNTNAIESGTVFYLNKDYVIENDIRKFNTKKVLLASNLIVTEKDKNLLKEKGTTDLVRLIHFL